MTQTLVNNVTRSTWAGMQPPGLVLRKPEEAVIDFGWGMDWGKK